MRLIPLEVGRVDMHMGNVDGTDTVATFPVASWLIEHNNQLAVFDTGMHIDLQTSIDRIGAATAENVRPDFNEGEELSARLAARGIDPADISLAIFSHLHFDHCGGTAELPNARLMLQQAEWTAGHDTRMIEHRVYNPDDYDIGHDVHQVDGEHDVFGDGRVLCIPTPGHTKGHQSLQVNLDSGPVVLTGDCIYTERMLSEMIVPTMASPKAQEIQRASMHKLAALRDQHGCQLIYGHDEAQFRALPSAGLT